MTPSTRSSKHPRPQATLSAGAVLAAGLVAVLAAGLVAGCSSIINKKIGDREDVCGDGVRGPTEECEGSDFGGLDCKTYNGDNATGHLECDEDCRIDVQYCTGGGDCGNDICEPGEYDEGCGLDCWPDNCGDGFCQYWENIDFCAEDCTGPIECGNGEREHGEDCDGGDLGNTTCDDLGFGGGDLMCSGDCRFIVDGCDGAGFCGDGVAGPGEQCDGDDTGGHSCASIGYLSGDLGCLDDCRFDDFLCNPNNQGFDGEHCVTAGDCMGDTCLNIPVAVGPDKKYCSHVCDFGICPGAGICIPGPGGMEPLCYSQCAEPVVNYCQDGFECQLWGLPPESICWPVNPI